MFKEILISAHNSINTLKQEQISSMLLSSCWLILLYEILCFWFSLFISPFEHRKCAEQLQLKKQRAQYSDRAKTR